VNGEDHITHDVAEKMPSNIDICRWRPKLTGYRIGDPDYIPTCHDTWQTMRLDGE